jgi:hypothetical protein
MSTIRGCIYGALLVFINSNAVAGDFSGVLKSQTSFSVETDKLQQQEWLLDLEYNEEVFGGDLTIIGRARLDTVDDLNYSSIPDSYSSVGGPLVGGSDGIIDLREFYWDVASDNTFLRLGKQQVVWGEADGRKLLDVINPQSFREFILDDFDDSRTPLWMVNIEHSLNSGGVLQLLWIPDTTAHELAPSHSPFAFTSTSLVPQTSASSLTEVFVEEAKAPSVTLENSDTGLRFVHFVGGWDISVNYLYHYVDTPVARTSISGDSVVVTQT